MSLERVHGVAAARQDPSHARDRLWSCCRTTAWTHVKACRTGTGLGTYSARLMAEVQRGRIGMETSDEQGTTITVQLPVQTEP